MLNKKSLVILAGLLTIIAFMILISWSPATVMAQGPTATPQPPVAVLDFDPVPANAALPGAITATIKTVTDTAVGERPAVVAVGTTGLSNVPVNVPVFFQVSAKDPKNSGKPTWSLVKPPESKATITSTTAMGAKFTPDVVGAYMVSVQLKNDAGVASNTDYLGVNAGTFIGVTAGNCKQCHPGKFEEWAKTGHAVILSENIDNKASPNSPTHYSEGCLRCHSTGYFQPPANNGGFADAQAKTGWKMPTFAQIEAAGKKTGPSNFDTMPAEVKNMANIQCEQCHGPASEHVKNGAKVMAVQMDNGACDVCHAGGGHHIKGIEIQSSKHMTGTSFEEITGPARQACARCHSAEGFVTFTQTPKNQAAWATEEGTVGCATCHDPHSDATPYQLRIVGKPVEIPFEVKKDVGLSAICFTCHNARTNPADAIKSSFPHYSSIAEMLSDQGGVTYGQTLPNSPHGMLVGAAPITNPAFAKDPTTNQFLFSKAGDSKGNIPGPCVTCHMTASPSDPKDPAYMTVGEHSFNTVSPDGKTDYGASCQSCHGEVKDFNLKAKADYDGNGKVEGVQDEVKGLLNVLWKGLEAKGFKKVDSGYPYATLPKDADDKMKNAWYNYRTVYGVMWGAGSPGQEGKAQAIHNFKRSVALLQLSLKDLTGSLPAGMAEMK